MEDNMAIIFKTQFRKVLYMALLFGIIIALFGAGYLIFGVGVAPVVNAQGAEPPAPNSTYFISRTLTLGNGVSLTENIINGPPTPPPGYELERAAVVLPRSNRPMASRILTVPAFNWVFGCSSVSGAMIAGYYDRNGFANMYTGPTNGGTMPLDNSSWPTWSDGYSTYPNLPLAASHNGVDGRATRGSIDDYWVQYGSSASDPYITGGWTQHTWSDAIGDYMKTSQSAYGNTDGSTSFYNYTSSATPLTCSDMVTYGVHTLDGTYGRKLFYEARGYTVTNCYSQKTDNTVAGGFSFAQYKAEIDAGRPVMLNLEGHTIVGVGYDDATNTVYLHDTWDYNNHTMTWGTSYSGMALLSVSIVNLAPSTKISTTTSMTSAPNPSTYWQAVTFTATVTSTVGTPSGTIQFYADGAMLGGAQSLTSGQAIYVTNTLAAGTRIITATYSGDTTYATSTSSNYSHTVNQANTTTSVASAPNPSTYGQAVTFTATVTTTAGMPSGTVTFYDNGSSLGGGTLNASGVTTLTIASLSVGTHPTITTQYAGNTNYNSSTSNNYSHTVNKANTTTSVTSTPNPSGYGQSVTFTATVTSTVGIPSGTVTFYDNGSSLGSNTLNTSGITTLTTFSLSIGTHPTITAQYAGTANYNGSTSNSYSHTVNKANTTTSVTSTPNPSGYGQSVTFTATVTSTTGVPSGTMQFYADGVLLGGAQSLANGQAAYITHTLTTGAHVITAIYSGDATYNPSSGVLNGGQIVTNLAPLANAGPDQNVFVNALVALNGSASTDPDGHLPLAYEWVQSGGPTVVLNGITISQPTFTAPGTSAVLTFTLIVTDALGAVSVPDEVAVLVNDHALAGLTAVNDGPTSIGAPTLFTATITAGSNVLYAWNFGDGSFGTGTPLAHTYAAAGTYTAIVTATNSSGFLTATTTVQVFDKPVAQAGSDQSVRTGAAVTLIGSASSDPGNFLPLIYHWQQTGGQAVTLSSANNVTATFTAPIITQPKVLTFELTVTNTQSIVSLPDVVVITIEPYRVMLPLVLR
jgi:hypothetical protein